MWSLRAAPGVVECLLKINSVLGREAAYGLAKERFEGLGDYNVVARSLPDKYTLARCLKRDAPTYP